MSLRPVTQVANFIKAPPAGARSGRRSRTTCFTGGLTNWAAGKRLIAETAVEHPSMWRITRTIGRVIRHEIDAERWGVPSKCGCAACRQSAPTMPPVTKLIRLCVRDFRAVFSAQSITPLGNLENCVLILDLKEGGGFAMKGCLMETPGAPVQSEERFGSTGYRSSPRQRIWPAMGAHSRFPANSAGQASHVDPARLRSSPTALRQEASCLPPQSSSSKRGIAVMTSRRSGWWLAAVSRTGACAAWSWNDGVHVARRSDRRPDRTTATHGGRTFADRLRAS
jgi:hypothetical protein